MTSRRLILASASPRRAELMRQIGLAFEIVTSDVEDTAEPPPHHPEQYARTLALLKAEDVAARVGAATVIGADTIVVLDEQILNKPRDDGDALRMLSMLQGRTHQVITAVALVEIEDGIIIRRDVRHVSTDVTMRRCTTGELNSYIATGEPHDKAGAYAIQGRAGIFIESIVGDYFNVVGLPIYTLAQMLSEGNDEV